MLASAVSRGVARGCRACRDLVGGSSSAGRRRLDLGTPAEHQLGRSANRGRAVGPPAVWYFHRERRQAGLGNDRVQPVPRHRHARRHRSRRSAQRHHPAQTHPNPGTDLDLGQETRPAPAQALALRNRMESAVRRFLRTAPNSNHLTTQPRGKTGPGTSPVARPDPSPYPPAGKSDLAQANHLTPVDR